LHAIPSPIEHILEKNKIRFEIFRVGELRKRHPRHVVKRPANQCSECRISSDNAGTNIHKGNSDRCVIECEIEQRHSGFRRFELKLWVVVFHISASNAVDQAVAFILLKGIWRVYADEQVEVLAWLTARCALTSITFI
jgi:hypothetical protein